MSPRSGPLRLGQRHAVGQLGTAVLHQVAGRVAGDPGRHERLPLELTQRGAGGSRSGTSSPRPSPSRAPAPAGPCPLLRGHGQGREKPVHRLIEQQGAGAHQPPPRRRRRHLSPPCPRRARPGGALFGKGGLVGHPFGEEPLGSAQHLRAIQRRRDLKDHVGSSGLGSASGRGKHIPPWPAPPPGRGPIAGAGREPEDAEHQHQLSFRRLRTPSTVRKAGSVVTGEP